MKLTVFGATGGVGRHVVTQALDRGDQVTAYVRNPAKLDIGHPELTVIAGELTDRDGVQRACTAPTQPSAPWGRRWTATRVLLVGGEHVPRSRRLLKGVAQRLGVVVAAPLGDGIQIDGLQADAHAPYVGQIPSADHLGDAALKGDLLPDVAEAPSLRRGVAVTPRINGEASR